MVKTLKEKLMEVIKPILSKHNYVLIGIELIRCRRMLTRIYIDKKYGNITLEDCVIVSRQISTCLDKEGFVPVSYILEVSSPGLNRPLFSRAHFVQFIGSEIYLILRVMLYGRRRWRGIIKTVNDDESFVLAVENKNIDIMLSNVQKANLVPHV